MQRAKIFIQRHAITVYFCLVLLISYGSFLLVIIPKLLHGEAMQAADEEYILFPVIVLGVCLVGIVLTSIVDGKRGLRDLFARIGRWQVGMQWYAVALLTLPVLILLVLLAFRTLVSPIFTPHIFLIGIPIGLVPGFLEEVGWMGFVFPKMSLKFSPLTASLLLGVLWGLWHAPVVDYLGAAAPHGIFWLPFFLTFIAMMMAVRVLIVWIYSNTKSVLLAQLMHFSSTASLIVLDPAHISPAQETLWYACYAAVLWIVVMLVIARYGKNLVRQPEPVNTVQAVTELKSSTGLLAQLEKGGVKPS